MGFTGVLELAALALFALNLAMTVRDHQRIYSASEPLTANVHVRHAINVRPELQQRLREIGISMFDEATFIAPSMTFGALALASGRQPPDLLSELALPSPATAVPSSQTADGSKVIAARV
jgi:hypothetical protein